MTTTTEAPAAEEAAPAPVSLRDAFLYWLKLGFVSFGGPAGQIAMMHTELVERRRWISEHRFLHALNYTMVLPTTPWCYRVRRRSNWRLTSAG